MEQNDKKRKPHPEGPSGSSNVKKQKPRTELSPDAKLLIRIFQKTEQPILHHVLFSSIATASQADLNAIKRLLGPLVTAALNPLHCVRCHKPFLQQENSSLACKIPHLEPENEDSDYSYSSDGFNYQSDGSDEWGYRLGGPRGQLMKFPCCGWRFRERRHEEAEERKEACVEEWHTADPSQVKYYIDPAESSTSKDKNIATHPTKKRSKYQNTGVITCQQAGCPSKS
ncbi:hypothetical protein FRC12_005681 [Ceratobasidium sp. 428]|nr:hypothetical protein FRC12_005681 [Ceratobasidium sp. 428]